MKKLSFTLITTLISLNVYASSDMLENLSDKQRVHLSKTAEVLSKDPQAVSALIKQLTDEKSAAKIGTKSESKDLDFMDVLKATGEALSVDLVIDTFKTIKTKIEGIWEKKEAEEEKKNTSLWNKIKHYGKKSLATYWAIEWNMIKFSWTVGFKVLKELGPTLLKSFS